MKRAKSAIAPLTLVALGVVFGDIGASPLYALETVFRFGSIPLTATNIYGVVSMVLWALVLIVSVKYLGFIVRADNDGEGGVLALVALLRKKISVKSSRIVLGIALIGLAFFYADSMITPALSVLAALGGLRASVPELNRLIVPIAVIVLIGVFTWQSRGSSEIGKYFGPVMLVWFVVSGAAGLIQIVSQPSVLSALSPLTGLAFMLHHPGFGFLTLTAVALALTGSEALYADMGHVGRPAVRRAWFYVAFPALVLTYMGQAAIMVGNPSVVKGLYFALFPDYLRLPMTIFAVLVTVMAAQAVLSGIFSLTRQAVRLGYVPPLLIKHTSSEEAGQVYIASLNWLMCAVVVAFVVLFSTGEYLASALALAVSVAWLVDGVLFAVVAREVFKWKWWRVLLFVVVFISIDSALVVTGISKIWFGAWIPIIVAAVVLYIIVTWTQGRRIVARERRAVEWNLEKFVRTLRRRTHPLPRPDGCAVYLAHHNGATPMALRATVDHLNELMKTVLIVNVKTLDVPHVPADERASLDELGFDDDGISHITLTFGFNDIPNVPRALEHIRGKTRELNFIPARATYFVSDTDISVIHTHRMSQIQKRLFVWMRRNATKETTYFHLPVDRTIDMASYLEL